MFGQISKVLVLAPHPDDAEFGLGGTIVKLLEMGKEVHIAVFSTCEKSTPPGFERGDIMKEFYASCAFMGIDSAHVHAFDFSVRDFPQFRQDILESLVDLKKAINPDLVFIPCSSDIHQDHETIHKEGLRAFKYACLLGYEMPWNNFGFTSYVYVKLSQDHIDKKTAALRLYKTQEHRSYSNIDFVLALAKVRGNQIQCDYAESFEMIRYFQI